MRYFTSYFNLENQEEHILFAKSLKEQLPTKPRPLLFLCIGSDRVTGDCLGPIVGEMLLNSPQKHLHVYGSLSSPVHGENLISVQQKMTKEHSNPFVIAIDASLGEPSHLGLVTLSNAPICPGKGVNKCLPALGDLSITGIVNQAGPSGFLSLQSTRLYKVMKLSQFIVSGIQQSLL